MNISQNLKTIGHYNNSHPNKKCYEYVHNIWGKSTDRVFFKCPKQVNGSSQGFSFYRWWL